MAKVAPLLDIELVALDRAACCGAGVIAEHDQELADTLNARTFALAQKEIANGASMMMNICSTCQGAQSECQERLDANAAYRSHVNETLSTEGLAYEKGISNKHFLWLLVEEIGLEEVKRRGKSPPTKPRRGSSPRSPTCVSVRSTAATSCVPPIASGSTESIRGTRTCTCSSRRWAARSATTPASTSAVGSRSSR